MGSSRRKNAFFLSAFFKNCPKAPCFACFFNVACSAENLTKTGRTQKFRDSTLSSGIRPRGGFRGGGGGRLPLGDPTTCRPKGCPFVLFLDI